MNDFFLKLIFTWLCTVSVCQQTSSLGLCATNIIIRSVCYCGMKGIDELAKKRNVETLYLHVDVQNKVACHVHQRAGYIIIGKHNEQPNRKGSGDRMCDQFTTSLNLHDGATKGRKHYLMYKHLVPNPTWIYSSTHTHTMTDNTPSPISD